MKNKAIIYLVSIVVLVICIKDVLFLLNTFGLLTFRSFDSNVRDYLPINFDFLSPGLSHGLTPGLSHGLTPGLSHGLTPGLSPDLNREYFTPNQNVNMPINTNYSCSNICGTQNRCHITGEQCTSDVDCFGCQPKKFYKNGIIHPDPNRAPIQKRGYWVLGTTNIFYPENERRRHKPSPIPQPFMEGFSPAPDYNKGVNTWRSAFDMGMNLYKERYEPKGLPLELNYPKEYTLSGEFLQSVPYASNA